MTFVNLSNHPLSTWPPAQLGAARALGFGEPVEPTDRMPDVPAEADKQAVARLAGTLAADAVARGATAAFVATDYTLTLALVRALRDAGIQCFSATTRRETLEETGADGSVRKTSRFRFVRWREYV